MRRSILALLGIAVAGAGLTAGIWSLRSRGGGAPETATVRPAPVHPPAPAARWRPASVPHGDAPSLPGREIPSEVEARLAAAHGALLAAVDPCWDQPGPPATPAGAPDATVQKLRFQYRLVVEHGEGRAEGVLPIDSSISDPAMDACLLDHVRSVRWRAKDLDGAVSVSDIIRLGDLAMRRRPVAPR